MGPGKGEGTSSFEGNHCKVELIDAIPQAKAIRISRQASVRSLSRAHMPSTGRIAAPSSSMSGRRLLARRFPQPDSDEVMDLPADQ